MGWFTWDEVVVLLRRFEGKWVLGIGEKDFSWSFGFISGCVIVTRLVSSVVWGFEIFVFVAAATLFVSGFVWVWEWVLCISCCFLKL